MGVAKSDFSQMRWSDLDLIKNAERFARIDLDRSRFEKERNQYELWTIYRPYFSLVLLARSAAKRLF